MKGEIKLNNLIDEWRIKPPYQCSEGKADDEWVKLERAHRFILREINMTEILLRKVDPDKRAAPVFAADKGQSIEDYYDDLLMNTCEAVHSLEYALPIVSGYLQGIFHYLQTFGHTKLTEGGDNDKG